MRGQQLASTLMEQMDLPQEYAQKQFTDMLVQYGLNQDTLTLDQLREVLADYLQNTLLDLKETMSESFQTGDTVHTLPPRKA